MWSDNKSSRVPADGVDAELTEVPHARVPELQVPRLVEHHPDQREGADAQPVGIGEHHRKGDGYQQCGASGQKSRARPAHRSPVDRRGGCARGRCAVSGCSHSRASCGLPAMPLGRTTRTARITTIQDRQRVRAVPVDRDGGLDETDDVGGVDRPLHLNRAQRRSPRSAPAEVAGHRSWGHEVERG